MFRFLTDTFHRLIDEVAITKKRFLYDSFALRNRLTGLVGPRGVGKTTLLLQYIKEHLYEDKKPFYFSADLIYFQQTSLLEFVSKLHLNEGYQIIFIDEVHKYAQWSQELKNLYDAFPSLKIVFSGSSMLDLVHGSGDLSRRAKLYRLPGMSFREYLNFVTDEQYAAVQLEALFKTNKSISAIPRVLHFFNEYLKLGYYPFVFEDVHSYYEKLLGIIEKTIYEDIANFYQLKTANLHLFKKILTFLGSIPPGEINIHNISQNLGIDHKTCEHYLVILQSVGLARFLYPYGGGSGALRKPHKMFLNNTTCIHALQQYHGKEINKGLQRELFFIQSMQDAGKEIYFSKQGDFRTQDFVFEIGGKNKGKKQLKEVKETAFIVKDDILTPLKEEIPLFYFGFLY
jgi:predicted AAA+ superfamily ATPase